MQRFLLKCFTLSSARQEGFKKLTAERTVSLLCRNEFAAEEIGGRVRVIMYRD